MEVREETSDFGFDLYLNKELRPGIDDFYYPAQRDLGWAGGPTFYSCAGQPMLLEPYDYDPNTYFSWPPGPPTSNVIDQIEWEPARINNNHYAPETTTTYTIRVFANGSECPQILTATVKVPKVEVVSCSGDPGGPYSIGVEVIDGQGPYSYYKNGNSDGEYLLFNTHLFTGLLSGNTVTVEDRGGLTGCALNVDWEDSEACDGVVLRKGYETLVSEPAFKLYPNPARDEFTLNYHLDARDENVIFEVYDTKGARVFRVPLEDRNGAYTIDTNTWAEGVYVCRIVSTNKMLSVLKLVIMHD